MQTLGLHFISLQVSYNPLEDLNFFISSVVISDPHLESRHRQVEGLDGAESVAGDGIEQLKLACIRGSEQCRALRYVANVHDGVECVDGAQHAACSKRRCCYTSQ